MARRGRYVDFHEISFFAEQLQKAGKEIQPTIRKTVQEAAQVTTDEMKSRASWSSRIPGAISTKVSFAQRGAGITIRVNRRAAPHARPFEGLQAGASRGQFRHPVFGHRDRWVSQATRPFFRPAIEATRAEFVSRLETALIRTLPK